MSYLWYIAALLQKKTFVLTLFGSRWNKRAWDLIAQTRLPPDADRLRQYCIGSNYLSYLVRHPSLKHHPSPIGHGWELVGGRRPPVRHTRPVPLTHLPASGPAEETEEDEHDLDEEEAGDDVIRREDSSDDSRSSSEAECSDSDWCWTDEQTMLKQYVA